MLFKTKVQTLKYVLIKSAFLKIPEKMLWFESTTHWIDCISHKAFLCLNMASTLNEVQKQWTFSVMNDLRTTKNIFLVVSRTAGLVLSWCFLYYPCRTPYAKPYSLSLKHTSHLLQKYDLSSSQKSLSSFSVFYTHGDFACFMSSRFILLMVRLADAVEER